MALLDDLRNGHSLQGCFRRNRKRLPLLSGWPVSMALEVGERAMFQWIQPSLAPKSAVLKATLQVHTGPCLKLKVHKALLSIMQLYLILPGFPNSGEKPLPVHKSTEFLRWERRYSLFQRTAKWILYPISLPCTKKKKERKQNKTKNPARKLQAASISETGWRWGLPAQYSKQLTALNEKAGRQWPSITGFTRTRIHPSITFFCLNQSFSFCNVGVKSIYNSQKTKPTDTLEFA